MLIKLILLTGAIFGLVIGFCIGMLVGLMIGGTDVKTRRNNKNRL